MFPGEVPGSKTKFVCFRQWMHERYTGYERFRFCYFAADGGAKSRTISFVSVSLSSLKSNLRHPTFLFLSELGLCSCLTVSPISHHALKLWSNMESGYGKSLYGTQIIAWWSGFMNTSDELFARKWQTVLTVFAWDIKGCVSDGLKSNVFLEPGSIQSTPSAPSTLMIGTEKISKKVDS